MRDDWALSFREFSAAGPDLILHPLLPSPNPTPYPLLPRTRTKPYIITTNDGRFKETCLLLL